MKKRFVMILFMLIALMNTAVYSISLDETLSMIDKTYEVEFAELMVKEAERQLATAGFIGDFSVNFDPTVKAVTSEEGAFGETVSISGSIGFKIPIGLSSPEKEKLRTATDNLDQALHALEEAKEKAFIKLFGLYQYAWLVQEENKILASELESAQVNITMLRNLYKKGEVSLLELTTSEAEVEIKQESIIRGNMELRISWLDIAYTVGFQRSNEILEKGELILNDLPLPPELVDWALEHNSDVYNQMVKIRQLEASINRVKGQDFSIDIKTFLNMEDHSASLTYDFTNPGFNGSYSFPIYTFFEAGLSSGNGSTSTWNKGITLGLSYTGNKADTLDAEKLQVDLQLETAKLEAISQEINLEVRTAYQQWIKAQNSLEQAERNLERSYENKKLVETKKQIGQVSESELLEAETLIQRSLWKVEAAGIEEEKAKIGAAAAASYFSEIYTNIIKEN